MTPETLFTIIDMDGINVGVRGSFHETWLCFDEVVEAVGIADHWDAWAFGADEADA